MTTRRQKKYSNVKSTEYNNNLSQVVALKSLLEEQHLKMLYHYIINALSLYNKYFIIKLSVIFRS